MDYFLQILPPMLDGALLTLKFFLVALVLSVPLGLILAMLRISKSFILQKIIGFYILIMRGTPLLLQIMFFYFGLPILFDIVFAPFTSGVIALTLNYAAYYAEIYRGGIQSIGNGQYEAAKVLGLTPHQTMRRIILPQMWKKILPPFGNETIMLVKDTSLVYIVAISELMRTTQSIVTRDFNTFAFVVAAAFYLLMTLCLTKIFQYMEKRYAVYED